MVTGRLGGGDRGMIHLVQKTRMIVRGSSNYALHGASVIGDQDLNCARNMRGSQISNCQTGIDCSTGSGLPYLSNT